MNVKCSVTAYAAAYEIDGSAEEILRHADAVGCNIGIYATDDRPAGKPSATLTEALEAAKIDRSLVYIVVDAG